jgi:outer membrane protein assembly factor BamB
MEGRVQRASGGIYAFEKLTGKVRWRFEGGRGVPTSILRLGKRIYFVTFSDELICLDLETGRRSWAFGTGAKNDQSFINITPVGRANLIFFGALNGKVYALDSATGKALWERDLGSRISSLVLSTESLYAGTAGKRIYHLNSKTGEVMREFVASAELYWQFVLSRDSLITHIGEKTLICLPKSLDKPQWTQDSTTPWSSSRPYVWQGLAIVGTEDGRVDALQLTDGKRQWTYKFTGPLVVSAGMKVFCTSGRAGVGSTRSSRNKDLKFQPDLTQPKEKGI